MISGCYRHLVEANNDQNVRRRAENYLRRRLDSFPAIVIAVENGTVILQGVVPSYSMQWRCRECCRRIAGVIKVVDSLVVVPSHPAASLQQAVLPATLP